MSQYYKRLLGALVNLDGEMETEETYAELIAAYVDCQQAGDDPEKKLPAFHALLQTRLDLQELVAAVQIMLDPVEQTDPALETSRPAQYNLSFLQPTQQLSPALSIGSPLPIWTQISDRLYHLRSQLTLQIQERMIRLTDLDELLIPYHRLVPTPTGLRLRSASESGLEDLEIQELPSPEQNRVIILSMGLVYHAQGIIRVEVREIDPTDEPQRVSVTLFDADHQLLQRISVGLNEVADFSDLTRGHHLLVVKDSENVWEIPINLVEK